jgi:hypothetical protein
LNERLELEKIRPAGSAASPRSIEPNIQANAFLGDLRALPKFRRLLDERFHGHNFILEDAIGMLEENTSGSPRTGEVLPGEENYRWAFDQPLESSETRRKFKGKKAKGDTSGDEIFSRG